MIFLRKSCTFRPWHGNKYPRKGLRREGIPLSEGGLKQTDYSSRSSFCNSIAVLALQTRSQGPCSSSNKIDDPGERGCFCGRARLESKHSHLMTYQYSIPCSFSDWLFLDYELPRLRAQVTTN